MRVDSALRVFFFLKHDLSHDTIAYPHCFFDFSLLKVTESDDHLRHIIAIYSNRARYKQILIG